MLGSDTATGLQNGGEGGIGKVLYIHRKGDGGRRKIRLSLVQPTGSQVREESHQRLPRFYLENFYWRGGGVERKNIWFESVVRWG